MSRKKSSRSGRSTRSIRAEVEVPATTPDVKPVMGPQTQLPPVAQLHRAQTTSSPALSAESVHEQIARRAYELFLARGGAGGDPLQDWFCAERELHGSRAA
jgi:hypothetical protein